MLKPPMTSDLAKIQVLPIETRENINKLVEKTKTEKQYPRTRFALGKQSKILSINFAFPSGSSGKHTPETKCLYYMIIMRLPPTKIMLV